LGFIFLRDHGYVCLIYAPQIKLVVIECVNCLEDVVPDYVLICLNEFYREPVRTRRFVCWKIEGCLFDLGESYWVNKQAQMVTHGNGVLVKAHKV
jgi:hypothetical protein